jgi:ribose 5-phosphate isomerase A
MSEKADDLKRQAAEKAVELVTSGMIVGLGTGSTADHAIRAIGERLQDGRLQTILGIPTSEATARAAREAGIPLTTLDTHPVIDLTIDGADEIDPALNLIKGLGGALLREKIVALASKQVIIVADERKQVAQLGTRAPVPVEVIAFARRPVTAYLESLGARVVERREGERPFYTDEGNMILDCYFGLIDHPVQLARALRAQTGVVEHGLFLEIATTVIIASAGGVQTLRQPGE